MNVLKDAFHYVIVEARIIDSWHMHYKVSVRERPASPLLDAPFTEVQSNIRRVMSPHRPELPFLNHKPPRCAALLPATVNQPNHSNGDQRRE